MSLEWKDLVASNGEVADYNQFNTATVSPSLQVVQKKLGLLQKKQGPVKWRASVWFVPSVETWRSCGRGPTQCVDKGIEGFRLLYTLGHLGF